MIKINKKVLSWAKDIEEAAMIQIMNMAKLDIIQSHLAIMPDVHAGIGSTVGTVIPTYKAIIPAAVGVDIGCGMQALSTNIHANELPESLSYIRSSIEEKIPVGFNWHKEPIVEYISGTEATLNSIVSKHPIEKGNYLNQLGTLGGGNHFIELCLDQYQMLWIMLHSGSRGIGNRIGQYFIEKAKEDMIKNNISLPDIDLAYLTNDSEFYKDYCFSLRWAQNYAFRNRHIMMNLIVEVIHNKIRPFKHLLSPISCHHNYVEFLGDICLTRKGAINAESGKLGIIPGSMGTKSYIVKGKGNPDSHHSCSHGAGRIMSRSQARKRFTIEDLQIQTSGVECRKDKDVIDEIPGAYKNIDEVMNQQSDLVEILYTLKQIMCIKG